jgi:putative transposase
MINDSLRRGSGQGGVKVQLNGRLKLSDAERGVLGEIGHRLGRKVLAEVATVARPDTILG